MRSPGRHVPRRRTALSAAAGAVALALVIVLPSSAVILPQRTGRISAVDGSVANGDSANPSVSSTGRLIAFDSSATNFGPPDENGPVRDVYAMDAVTGLRLLVSRAPGGPPADGPSSEPELSGPSRRVVFTSAATNLVPGDSNGADDIFLREGDGAIQRVSLSFRGEQANGPSSKPDISDDGRFVVFASSASNLVQGDTNGVEDIFVRDLMNSSTRRVSLRGRNRQSDGRSGTPSISPEGRFVSFESEATNLVSRDRNGIADVFLRDVSAGRTTRVSVSREGREQNRSVVAPFRQASDVSRNGQFVTFESDASTLVRGDNNRDTDVFVSDRRRRRIERVSLTSGGLQGDNDSFAPAITPDGRFVIFQSFAGNLAPGGAEREDIFIRDRRRGATVLVSVSAEGQARGPEVVPQLLQQPAISNNGQVAAFASTADNLVAGDTNGLADLFLRLLAPPTGALMDPTPRYVGRGSLTFNVTTDDPQGGRVLCTIDRGQRRDCGFRTASVSARRLAEGRHVMRAQIGGPGMLFDFRTHRFTFTVDRSRPAAVIDTPRDLSGRRFGVVRGRAGDRLSGVDRVQIAINQSNGRTCSAFDGDDYVRVASCRRPRVWLDASGARRWRRTIDRPRGPFVLVFARAIDRVGNASRVTRSRVVIR